MEVVGAAASIATLVCLVKSLVKHSGKLREVLKSLRGDASIFDSDMERTMLSFSTSEGAIRFACASLKDLEELQDKSLAIKDLVRGNFLVDMERLVTLLIREMDDERESVKTISQHTPFLAKIMWHLALKGDLKNLEPRFESVKETLTLLIVSMQLEKLKVDMANARSREDLDRLKKEQWVLHLSVPGIAYSTNFCFRKRLCKYARQLEKTVQALLDIVVSQTEGPGKSQDKTASLSAIQRLTRISQEIRYSSSRQARESMANEDVKAAAPSTTPASPVTSSPAPRGFSTTTTTKTSTTSTSKVESNTHVTDVPELPQKAKPNAPRDNMPSRPPDPPPSAGDEQDMEQIFREEKNKAASSSKGKTARRISSRNTNNPITR